LRIAGFRIGDSLVEYLQPLATDSPISRFLEKHNNAIHHVAFRVENLDNALFQLKQKGFRLIDEQARNGTRNSRIAFLHPASFNGILIELCEI
jgi:methylmalonyl-CoA/ethylmalonyl-CoA epimerase